MDPGSSFSARAEKRDNLADFFATRDTRIEDAQELLENKRAEDLQKRQIDDYKAMVGYTATPLYDFSQLSSSTTRTPLSRGPAIPVPTDPYNPFALAPSTLNPTLDPGLLAPAAPPLPVPSSLSAVPFVPHQAKTTAPKPVFSIPQRVF